MLSLNRRRISVSSAVTLVISAQAVACAATLVISGCASAQGLGQDDANAYGLSGSISLGAALTSTYEGSPNRRTLVGPDLSVSYRTRNWGSIELGQRGLIWQAVETGDFKLGLAAGFDAGRKTKDSSATDPTPGDKRLAGMGDVAASAEAGVLLGYGPISLLARKSLGDRGHKGTQVDLNAEWPVAVTHTLGLRFGAGLTWASDLYMQAYFGVTAAQAQTSGFRAYTPKAGLRKFEASVGAECEFTKDWKLQSTLAWSRLTGDAANSPLVERKASLSAAFGIAYAF